jgi:deferrochelatase/peroxidase EfeB
MPSGNPVIFENEAFLEAHGADLQAAIFHPHRKPFVELLFLHFEDIPGKKAELLKLLGSMARNSETRRGLYLTSSKNQMELNAEPDLAKRALFCNLFLTSEGLRFLGREGADWATIIDHLDGEVHDLAGDHSFERHYEEQASRVHAVMLLAHEQRDALLRGRYNLKKQFFPRAGVRLLFLESGQVYRQKYHATQRHGFAVEHFGYADGLSNPWITRQDTEFKGQPKPRQHWDPTYAVKELLIQEPGKSEMPCFGTYLVYRKYEQHVGKFNAAVEQLAEKAGLDYEATGALAIGRRRDGKPLVNSDADELNDFNYQLEGKCPMFAHIRKANPRNMPDLGAPKRWKNAILRRGVTYGERATTYGPIRGRRFLRGDAPDEGVGLLFLSFQRDIDYFQEIIQRSRQAESDPIVGGLGDARKHFKHTFAPHGDLEIVHEGFGGFVSLKGGLNLYAPSINFFQALGGEKTIV